MCDNVNPICGSDGPVCEESTGNYAILVTPQAFCTPQANGCACKCKGGNARGWTSGGGGSDGWTSSGRGNGSGSGGGGSGGNGGGSGNGFSNGGSTSFAGGGGGGAGGFGAGFASGFVGGAGGSGGGSGGGSFFRTGSTGGGATSGSNSGSFSYISGLENDLLTSLENAIQVSVDSDYYRYVYDSSAVPTSGTGSGKVKFVATSPGGSSDTTAASGQTVSVSFDQATGMFTVDPGTGVPLAPVPFQAIMGNSFVSYGTGSVNGSIALRWDAATGRVYVRYYGTNGAITREFDFNMYSIMEGYQGTMNMTNLSNAINFSSFLQSSGSTYASGVKFQQFDNTAVTQGGDNYDFSGTYGTNSGLEDVTMYVDNVPGGDVYNGYSNPTVVSPPVPATGYILAVFESDNDISNLNGNGDKYEFLMDFDNGYARAYYNGAQIGSNLNLNVNGTGGFSGGIVSPTGANFSFGQNAGYGSQGGNGQYIITVNGVGGTVTRNINIDIDTFLTRTIPLSELLKYITTTVFRDRTGTNYGGPLGIVSYSATSAALPGTITQTGLANYDYRFDYGITGHLAKFYIHRGHFAYTGHTTVPAYSPPVPYAPPLVFDPANPSALTKQDLLDYLLYKEPTPISPTSAQGLKIKALVDSYYPTIKNMLVAASAGRPYAGSGTNPLGAFRASIQSGT